MHCWVSDKEARTMSNEQRTAVAEYVNVNIGNEMTGKCFIPTPMHPSLKRSYDILYPALFEEIVIRN